VFVHEVGDDFDVSHCSLQIAPAHRLTVGNSSVRRLGPVREVTASRLGRVTTT
jgi:hypothetical protein